MEAATAQVKQPRTRRRSARGSADRAERRLAFYMVSPSMLLIAAVAVYPIGYAIWLSLHEYSVRVPGLQRWAGPIGLRNYSTALQSSEFWDAFKTTFIFTGASVFLELVLGLAMAIAMHSAFKGRGLLRTVGGADRRHRHHLAVDLRAQPRLRELRALGAGASGR